MTGHTHQHGHQHGQQNAQQHGHDHHQHGHDHGHDGDFDWDALAVHLEREADLQSPAVTEAAHWLRGLLDGTPVQRVLDVGSGPGVIAGLLADAFPSAEVVAVDQSAALLERARVRSVGRVGTRQAELPEDFGTLGSAELIWSGNAIHHLGDQQAALTALAGTLRPGGLLAVAERGLPARYLPRDLGLGRPGLQARLDAAHEEVFAQMREATPGAVAVVEDWPAMLAEAGLVPSGTRTFLVDRPAPLDTAAREFLHVQLSRRREQLDTQLDAEDRAVLDALLDREAPTGILARSDAFYLTAITVHTARAAADR
ncbi:class I SAM-dependent methyltransferase [Kitasatospora purpeofusca]|uniref:class I SAM-dependent methyltransferase n=1 Tax=Kitasatospora purpeofusca TaxID=67352 RepID=UPI0004C1B2B7|nr:class I SAM-dependent methyltransferase [Kitasatospora purpeofusca]